MPKKRDYFLSKSPGGHVISFQIRPWVAFGFPYLIELFYIGMPVVRTDGRSLARSVCGHVITKFSRMGRLPHFLSYGALPNAYFLFLLICRLLKSNRKRRTILSWYSVKWKKIVWFQWVLKSREQLRQSFCLLFQLVAHSLSLRGTRLRAGKLSFTHILQHIVAWNCIFSLRSFLWYNFFHEKLQIL